MNFSSLAENLSIMTSGKKKVLTQTQLQNLGPVRSIFVSEEELDDKASEHDIAEQDGLNELKGGRALSRDTFFIPSLSTKADVMHHIELSDNTILLNCAVDASQVVNQSTISALSRASFVSKMRHTVSAAPEILNLSVLVDASGTTSDTVFQLFSRLEEVVLSTGRPLIRRDSPYVQCARTMKNEFENVDLDTLAKALLVSDLSLAICTADGTPVIALNRLIKRRGTTSRRPTGRRPEMESLTLDMLERFAEANALMFSSKPLIQILSNLKYPKKPLSEVPTSTMDALLSCRPPFHVSLYLSEDTVAQRTVAFEEAVGRDNIIAHHFRTSVQLYYPYWQMLLEDTHKRVEWYVAQGRARHQLHWEFFQEKRIAEIDTLLNEESQCRSDVEEEQSDEFFGMLQVEYERTQYQVLALQRRRSDVEEREYSEWHCLDAKMTMICDDQLAVDRITESMKEHIKMLQDDVSQEYQRKARLLHEATKEVLRMSM